MKDAIDSVPAERPVESDSFANRKLIRPSLNHSEHHHPQPSVHAQPSMMERRDRPERSDRSERNERNDRGGAGRKGAPPEQTNAENFYYQKQMQSKTAMVIVLRDGEEIRGTIEWYDKTCLKVNRNSQPNLMIYKPSIKYMYKEGENSRK